MKVIPAFKQYGGAIVEFVFVLPLLLLLMLATAELGRAFYQYNTLTKAVRDGARYLAANAIDGSTGNILIDRWRTATRNLVVYGNTAGSGPPLVRGLRSPGLTTGHVTVTQVGTDHVRVMAAYKYETILEYPIPETLCMPGFECINFGFTLNASATMRAL